MRDEHDDRIYQAFRHDLAASVFGLFSSIGYAFDRLHDRLYSAPWSQQDARRNCTRGKRFTAV